MELYYINQNSSIERRNRIEAMISNYCFDHKITRFEALEGNSKFGSLSKSEIGCFLSHQHLIDEMEGENRIIFEDDVVFNNDLINLLDRIDSLLDNNLEIIFFATHTPYFNILVTTQMLEMHDNIMQNNKEKYTLIDARGFYRSSCMAYAVSARAKDKISAELKSLTATGFNIAIDTAYFKMIQEGKLNASVIFPFPVSCSGQPSQLIDRSIDGIPQIYDQQLNLFSGIVDYKQILKQLIKSALDEEIDHKRIIASLLCYQHFLKRRFSESSATGLNWTPHDTEAL